MTTPTRAAVQAEARQLFGAEQLDTVMQVLDLFGTDPWNRTTPEGIARVQLALLRLSQGNIEKLRHFVAQARTDFRDVLHWAESMPGA